MAPPSRAFADAAAAALRALQCSGLGAADVVTDPSGRRPARQTRSTRAAAATSTGITAPSSATPTEDPALPPAAPETSVDPPPVPPSSPERAAEATEARSSLAPAGEASDSPPTPPPSASAPPSPTPAPSVTLATRGASVGGEAAASGRAEVGVGSTEVIPAAVATGNQQMLQLARLVVGVARKPPPRVNSALDRDLQAATNVGDVLAAAVAPPRLSLAEADELVDLRRDNDRLRAELDDTKDKLAEEMNLRTKSEYFLVSANSDCDRALDAMDNLRAELNNTNMQLMEANAAIAHHAAITQSLEGRTQAAEADAAAAVRRNTQIHERVKASLVTYNTQLAELRKRLADRDRTNVIPARIRALTDENNSLRRANSILRRHSAAHGLDVDTLALASAGISAAEVDWNLLGLSPPTISVESPGHEESSSEEEEESKAADVSMAGPTEGPSAPVASEVAHASSSESTGTSKRKRDSQAESTSTTGTASQPSPPKRLGRPSVDLRARAAAVAGSSSPRSGSGDVPARTRTSPRPSTTFRSAWSESQPLSYEYSDEPLYPRSTSSAPASQPAKSPSPRREGSPDFEFGGGGSPGDVPQDNLEPGEVPEASADTAEGEDTSGVAPATAAESPPAAPVPGSPSHVPETLASVGSSGGGRAEPPAGDNEGPLAPRGSPAAPSTRAAADLHGSPPAGGSPDEGSAGGSETSEDRAALMREMFGSDDEEEASLTQRTGTAAPPGSLAATAEAPAVVQATPAVPPRRPSTRSTAVHAHALVTATVTATPRAGPASIAPAVVDASDAAVGSRKLSNLAALFLEPGFTSPGAQECWSLIHNASVPLIFEDDVVAPCSVDGITNFGAWEDANHPFQVLRQLFPDPCLIDLTGYLPSQAISRRATGRPLLVRLSRQFQGNSFHPGEKGDLGLALWERRHWIRARAIKAYIADLASNLGDRHALVRALRQAWAKYHRERSYRADRLREQMVNKLWAGCIEYDREPRQHPTEVLLEPSYLQYSFEVMEWVPSTDDWVSELAELDAREPWRNCWFQDPASHPYNTAFAPCNDVPLFVPRGATREAVASSVVVEPSLRTSMVVAPWVTEFSAAHDARSPSPDEETKESDGGASSTETSLGVLAQAASEI